MRGLLAAIEADPGWPRTGPAALARRTLVLAAAAEPGALVDLARLATADLAACQAGPAVEVAARRVQELTGVDSSMS